jgi:PilZ domain
MTDHFDQNNAGTRDSPRVRGEPRNASAIMIEVSGFDETGRFFAEYTATQNISTHGCCFRLRTRIAPDALLTLQASSGEPQLPAHPTFYQVVWIKSANAGALVGAYRMRGEDALLAAPRVPGESSPRKS